MKNKIIYLSISFLLITGVIVWFNADWFNFVSAAGIDSYTKLLLHNNGVDTSKSHAITANGNAQIDTAQSYFGGASGLFDGTGDYVSAPDSEDWNFGSGDFTIDFWVRFNLLPIVGEQSNIFQQLTDANNMWGLQYRRDGASSGTLRFFQSESDVITIQIDNSWFPSTAIWYHVAIIKSSNNYYMFVDGVQIGTTQSDTTINANFNNILAIGVHRPLDTPGQYLNGWIDELRVSKGIARWIENFTPPGRQYTSDNYTALLLHLNGADAVTAIDDASGGDESGNNKIITYNGNAQIDTAQSYFGGASGLFDGTGDYLSTPDSDDWNFGSGDFTIDFWLRVPSVEVGGLIEQYVNDSNVAGLRLYGATGEIYFSMYSGGTLLVDFGTPSSSIAANTWYHVAFVHTGTTYKIFINGAQQGSITDSDNWGDYAAPLVIGYYALAGAPGYFNGWIDEFRISKGVARWTADFTPPGSAYSLLKRLIIY